MHLNARSLLGNLDKFKILLSNIKKPFSVIGITETWLNDQTHDLVDISGYKFVSNHRTTKPGGGVGLYLQNSLEYKLCSKCNYTNPDLIESIFVEICIPNGKNIIVGTVYRPPNQNVAAFLEKFNEIISIISKDNKPCYVMGDFNLDLLHYNHHVLTQEFVDNLFSHMFFPLITKPTRLTSHSATLLDNIFTNNPTRKILNGILLNDISDHLPVFAYIYDGPLLYNRFKKTIKRNFSESNLSKFQSFLAQTNWSNNLSKQDPNEAYNTFFAEYTKFYELCFPIITIKGNQRKKINNPWITKGLLKSIRKKNRLYKMFLKKPDSIRELHYKKYKNKLNHIIKNAKRLYYEKKFEYAKNDLKVTWNLLNEVINNKKSKSSLPLSFKIDDKLTSHPMDIANGFCKYFTNIGPNLANKIPMTNTSFSSFLTDNTHDSMNVLKPTSTAELEEICLNFKSQKAPGYDNLSMHVIKCSFSLISEPLKDIINLSFAKGVFPDKLKIAKIIPIYKAEDPEKFTNYRPISLLSNFAKFFDKVSHNRLIEFLEQYEILYRHQFGFRKNHSTSHALIHLVNKIASSIDRNEITAGIFLDLSKAFDTINHDILFAKLEHCGIRGTVLQWIKSYFSKRPQFVQFNETQSSMLTIKCGVPQGSILGPLFFIVYINDLANASKVTKSLLFADDTSIFYSHADIDHLVHVLNEELNNTDIWMKCNKLSINTKKTNYIIFKHKQKKIHRNTHLYFDDQLLERADETKFLGVYIDENLNWKSHIGHVCNKIAKSVGIIFKSRFLLSAKTKLMLFVTCM